MHKLAFLKNHLETNDHYNSNHFGFRFHLSAWETKILSRPAESLRAQYNEEEKCILRTIRRRNCSY
jgi:hypothetical protein